MRGHGCETNTDAELLKKAVFAVAHKSVMTTVGPPNSQFAKSAGSENGLLSKLHRPLSRPHRIFIQHHGKTAAYSYVRMTTTPIKPPVSLTESSLLALDKRFYRDAGWEQRESTEEMRLFYVLNYLFRSLSLFFYLPTAAIIGRHSFPLAAKVSSF